MSYCGVNHSRMTERMEERLRDMPCAFLALSRFRRLVGDGNTIQLYGGIRGWARWIGCSPGYSKKILARLAAEGFISAAYLSDGRADVLVLPPIELEERSGIDQLPANELTVEACQTATSMRSGIDQLPANELTVEACQTATSMRSGIDRMSHESHEQQQRAHPQNNNLSHQQRALYQRLLQQINMHKPTAYRIVTSHPGNLADFEHDLRLAQTRSTVRNAFWFTIGVWANGGRVTVHAEKRKSEKGKPNETTRQHASPDMAVGQRRPAGPPPGLKLAGGGVIGENGRPVYPDRRE